MNLTETIVVRTIPAPVEKVFDAWLDPNHPGGPWYGASHIVLHPAVDGLFYHVIEHEGRKWPHYGRFIRLDRPHHIEHTWVSEATKGVESVVAITLERQGDETELTLRHSGIPDDDMGRQHKDGWTWSLTMLAESFAKP